MKYNESIFRFFNDFAFRDSVFDNIFVFLTNDFGYFLIFALIIFLISQKGMRRSISDAILIFGSVGVASLVTIGLKYWYANPRPFEILENINILLTHGGGDSFPSGHATAYAALATAVYLHHKRLGIIFWLGAIVIGISRVIVGIHWPVDILAGFIIGALFSYITYTIGRRFFF